MNGTGRMFAAGVIVAVTVTVYLTGAKWISGRSGRGGGPKRRLTVGDLRRRGAVLLAVGALIIAAAFLL